MKDTKHINGKSPFVEGILEFLPKDKQKMYTQALYNIAKAAISARCADLPIVDLEISASLEDESNARFEDWLTSNL